MALKAYALSPPTEGMFMVVRFDNQWNFLDGSAQLVSDEWFTSCRPFHNGYAAIQRTDGLWSYLASDGATFPDRWFKEVRDMSCGLFCVKRKNGGRWGYMNEDGEMKGTFSYASSFKNGFATVKQKGKYYYIDTSMKNVHGPFTYATDMLFGGFGLADGQVIDVCKKLDLCLPSI